MNNLIPNDEDFAVKKPKILIDVPAEYDLAQSEYQYFVANAGRSTSFILKKIDDGTQEKFSPGSTLGQGGYGRVRLFVSEQENSHVFAVKNELQVGDIRTQADVDGRVRASIREVDYMARVNPGLKPYLVMNFINDKGHYDNRLLMPYFPGKSLTDFVNTNINSVPEFALLMLKVAQEVARVHQMGLFHGDLRSGNFIIQRANTEEFGMLSFSVRLIDFDHGGEIGKERLANESGDISKFEIILIDLDEKSDVMHLRVWMNMCLSDIYCNISDVDTSLDKYFTSFRRFIYAAGETETDPARRLNLFIDQMTENLHAWERLSKSSDNKKMRANSQSANSLWMQQDSKSEDDSIAKEWESTRSIL